MANPFELTDLRELILKIRKNEMERDLWRRRYSAVVDDLTCHQYAAEYISRNPISEDLIECCESGLYDHDLTVIYLLIVCR